MAKKNSIHGIYTPRSELKKNRIHAKTDPEGFREALDAMVAASEETAGDFLAEIHQNLVSFLRQFLDGPIDLEEARKLRKETRTMHHLDMGDGVKSYLLAADASEAAHDAIDAMYHLRVLLFQLGRAEGINIARYTKSAICLGELCEQIRVRPFEPLVATRKSSDLSLKKINDGKPSSGALKLEAKNAIALAEEKYPDRKTDKDFM